MLKYLYIITGLVFSANIAFPQEYYYWAYDQKRPLEVYTGKQYILTKTSNKELVAERLGISKEEVLDLKQLRISAVIKNNSLAASSGSNAFHWGVVNRALTKEMIKSSEIIYAAPFFKVNGKDIGLSQFFYVKLRQGQDIEQLETLATYNNVEIVGHDSFTPLWYILSCDRNSRGNALEMANLFYETGKFASSQPDLMEDFGATCTDDTFINQQWHLNNTGQSGGDTGQRYPNVPSVGRDDGMRKHCRCRFG